MRSPQYLLPSAEPHTTLTPSASCFGGGGTGYVHGMPFGWNSASGTLIARSVPGTYRAHHRCPATSSQPRSKPPHIDPKLTMLSIAVVPARTMRSPQDRASPYLALMGSNSFLALSRLVLSSQASSGVKRMRAPTQVQHLGTGQMSSKTCVSVWLWRL